MSYLSLAESVAFFLISNLGVRVNRRFCPSNFAGLIHSYVTGIPFFRNSVTGDLADASLMFGAHVASSSSLGGGAWHKITKGAVSCGYVPYFPALQK